MVLSGVADSKGNAIINKVRHRARRKKTRVQRPFHTEQSLQQVFLLAILRLSIAKKAYQAPSLWEGWGGC